MAAVNAAETVVIAAIVGGVCRATFVLGTCARRQLTALARAIISRDISGPEEASCASVGPEGLPFGRPVCGLAMRAGARTSSWGAHACCVPSAAGPGAQGRLGGKKRRSVFENPKIDGCEIFWRLNLQTQEFADWMRVHDQKRKFDREDKTVVRGIKSIGLFRRDTQASVFPLDRPESARASVPSAFHIFRGAWPGDPLRVYPPA